MKLRFLLATSLVLLPSLPLEEMLAQSREQLKQQAEARLRTMTSDEIEQKLKEFGLSREEAIRRAKDLNISLEEYLSRTPQAGADTTAPSLAAPPMTRSVPVPEVSKPLTIPGLSDRQGVETLQPFGYSIFQLSPSAFEPVLNLASPPSYVLGPGDELVITVWGETKLNYQLQINREGNVLVPEVGPVSASGSTIDEFKKRLLSRMSAIYSGLDSRYGKPNTFLDVSLGKIRTLQVFVLGEVVRPGGYAISSFATAFHALYAAGGPTINGSLRTVSVVRKGSSLPPIDVYDYVLRGDNSKDIRLQDGDVVFVKHAGRRVALTGSVVRPAIYELKEAETLGDLIALAGGLRFDAYFKRLHIERVVPFDQRTGTSKDLVELDLSFASLDELRTSSARLEDGDVVTVYRISDLVQNRVSISGNVRKPGRFELKSGMRVRDLILEADSLQRNTFSERGTLFRLLPNLRREILSFNPRLALEGDAQHNMLLENEDSLVVYPESQFFPQRTVTISGAVRNPGIYPRNEKMTVADLVVLAGGITEAASLNGWEISRIDTTQLGQYSTVHKIDVSADYWNNSGPQNFHLQDFDFVFVPSDPRFVQNKLVKLTGYVMSPGEYAIRYEGERLAELIKRAGGLRPGAYLEASRFIRRANNAGVIPINFRRALTDPYSRDNILLNEGDSIFVALNDDVVYVSGEVLAPSAILYKRGQALDYYIDQAGGLKQEADEDRIVAFLPNGQKWEPGWFFVADPELPPGSSITVPKKVEKEDKTLPTLGNIATILASLAAITIAIVQISK
jgi:protein involved in polysaccharide export with SLBB domain